MRALVLGCLAGLIAASCGSGSGGSGNTGRAQADLRVTAAGGGLVRSAGGDCRGSCSTQYTSGSQVHLVAVPDSGSFFVGWAGACSGSGGCDLTLDGDREVSATFAATPPPPPQGQRRLTVIVQGKGRVTSSPAGLDCDSSTCSADFPAGTSLSLDATASSGFTFAGWGSDCAGSGGCSLSLSKDATVYANFVAQPPPPPPAQVSLSASVTGPGTVTGGGLNCGESTFTCDVTVAGGSTVTLTASPAGGSRFAGWGGACTGTASTCQLTPQADTRVTAAFQSQVMALAPADGTNRVPIALNSTNVFWLRYTSGYGIWSIPKEGGDAVRVTTGFATAIVVDDAYLYWTDGSLIYSTPVGGGQAALLASASPIGKLALDEVGALYWTVGPGSSPGSGTIHRMQDRVDAVLAMGQSPTGDVDVNAGYVYFTDHGSEGSIRRVSRKAVGVVETLTPTSCGADCFPQSVRVDSQYVYYRIVIPSWYPAASGHVRALNKADGSVRVLSSGNGNGGYLSSLDLDANASVVYWTWSGASAPYGIFRANADGSGFGAIDTSNDTTWNALRVDSVALYYYHAGALIRRLK